ncbi:MAG: NAD(P)H-dependent oxidoreductase subunit E, partial [Desulfovibrionaceae bacterium]|nr:NAD(P)H-dependent oxidoreductase subunit E [Desulfovibrionaceae bacterium]
MARILRVCCGTGCLAHGAAALVEALQRELRAASCSATVEAVVKTTGCHGFCENGPIVTIMPDDLSYYRVRPDDAKAIVQETVIAGKALTRLLYTVAKGKKARSRHDNPFYTAQTKIVLRNIGEITPADIRDYVEHGGFEALRKALDMKPEDIIAEIERSGLRGRGGAGYPTGRKWRQCAACELTPKYVICNGDEGDPGAFMDRALMEGDPHSIIEGLAIAALAVGATEGFMYIRDEYGLAIANVQKALESARAAGYLGKNIAGGGRDFDIRIVRGGGAFVCGESSALMASIEGKVGEPRTKYIRSVQRGLWDKPTVLNNVETLANIPYIILQGADAFGKIGAAGGAGTKVFALVGKVQRTGLIEVPMGTSIRRLVADIGGGCPDGRGFKAVQTGGPSGGCIPAGMADLPLDFDTLTSHGSMMGSGGVIVMDDRTCMVEVARYYVRFLSEESCGKCTPCREGLRRMLRILTDICEGCGLAGDLETLELLGETLTHASLCGLGKSAANPVLSTLRYFRDEYEAHIREQRCPAGVCPSLTAFLIKKDACRCCGMCARACPVS